MLQVDGRFVFELSGRALTGPKSHVVAIETELIAIEVKGEYRVGLGDGCKGNSDMVEMFSAN